jgi:5-(carboxyamino)imidazole ribonucleotide synthase
VSALGPGSAIGILGGGQLGRMLAMAAAQLGFDAHIYTDEEDAPASRVSAKTVVADYHDHKALHAFAESVGVVTTEFENVPADTAAALVEAGARVAPNPDALAIAQDRFTEKTFFNTLGIPTTKFAAIDSDADLSMALPRIGVPSILKTRRLGYDGQGQARIAAESQARTALAAMKGAPAILEGFCGFEREISVVAARAADGSFSAYDPCENDHSGGILSRTTLPAQVKASIAQQARDAAERVAETLDYVGVLTIEFFVMADGGLIANEMAPRVHNSGHWTIEGAATSQFEQHIRAVAGWPLGSTARPFPVEMINLIGEAGDNWLALAREEGAHLHLYGKRDARKGRKMGHVTRIKRR